MESKKIKHSEMKLGELVPSEMAPKKLTFEKEVVARLQDEEMSHIMGASSHSNTSVSKDQKEALIMGVAEDDEELKSCCQKSCNKQDAR